jgi:hypothetical protein
MNIFKTLFDGYLIFLDSIETNDFQVIKNNRNLFSSKHVGQKNGKLCTDTLLIVGLLHFSFWDGKKFKFEKYFFLSNTPVVLSSDLVGVFCLPNSTESEKNFYVIRDQKVLESV